MPAQKNKNKHASMPVAASPSAAPHYTGGTELAAHLMDPHRSRTVVVVSYIPGVLPRIDTARVSDVLGPDVQVVEIANGIHTRQLQNNLPAGLHVFGNGARVYPHGPRWSNNTPPPLVLYNANYLPHVYKNLEREVLAAGHVPPGERTVTASQPVLREAVVIGFPSSDRAMLELSTTGERALIRAEDLLPDIPLDWLLNEGQKLTGVLNPDTNVMNIKANLLPPLSPVTIYKHGDVALARVKSVCPAHALVELWPGSDFRIDVVRISSNDLDSAEDLLTEGEVVRVRVVYESGAVVLSMLDVDDDEAAVPAPPLVRGGPAWLDNSRPYASLFAARSGVVDPETDSEFDEDFAGDGGADWNNGIDAIAGQVRAATQSAGTRASSNEALLTPAERRTALQSTQMQLVHARHTISELMEAQKRQGATDKVARALQDQLEAERKGCKELAKALNELDREKDALREELARTKSTLVQQKQQRRSTSSRSDSPPQQLFLVPEDQFRFELLLTWGLNVPAQDKAAHPLGDYDCSDQFLDSWAGLTEQQRRKTLRAVLDLVADRKGPMSKRDAHPLRRNEGAHASPTMRGDDVCMRLYVEQGTAGALRLHYWKLPSGKVELHRVVAHDVVKP